MPIELQCPDCEHTFRVPSSMVGQRTLCRGCNAALIVPEESVEESLPEVPPRRSRRPSESGRTVEAKGEEKPTNWDTPIPFSSPGPIVGVLLIALTASVLILGIYAIAHNPMMPSKPAPFTGTYSYATQPAAPSKPESKPVDAKPIAASDREVILPDREVIVPKFNADSALVANPMVPANWFVVRDTSRRGASFRIHDRATGRIVGSVLDHRDGVADAGVSLSPGGRRFLQIVDSSVELVSVADTDADAFTWSPYGRGGRKLAACVLLSDERVLTVSGDGSFDLWAIPSGEYIRRVALTTDTPKNPAFDICIEKSLLSIRSGAKIEVHALGDDDFGKLFDFIPDNAADADPDFRFSSDGKRMIVITPIREGAAAPSDRVDIFDLDRKRKSGEWTFKMQRRPGEVMLWSAGADLLTVHLPERGSVIAYGLSDGKVRSALEIGSRRMVQIERAGDRIWMQEAASSSSGEQPAAGRLYGFDLPLRSPLGIRKDPVWEYKSGVLELKKAGR